jgi:hypothetical protein
VRGAASVRGRRGALQKAEQPVNGAHCSAAAPREARNRFAATSSTPATGLEGAGLLGGASRKCRTIGHSRRRGRGYAA